MLGLIASAADAEPPVADAEPPAPFDEAHLRFAEATDAFLDSVVQTVRLIRSKGVGVFFITQTPHLAAMADAVIDLDSMRVDANAGIDGASTQAGA